MEKEKRAAAVKKLEAELKEEKQAEIRRRREITLERKKAAEERQRLEEDKAKVCMFIFYRSLLFSFLSDGSSQGCTSTTKSRSDEEN